MISGLKFFWTLLSWDLPADTRTSRNEARRLIRKIKTLSLHRIVDHRPIGRTGSVLVMGAPDDVLAALGPVTADGEVFVLGLTDKQLEYSKHVFGTIRTAATK